MAFLSRRTWYGGVLMRSRTEAAFAQWLDRWGIPWTYEPAAFGGWHGQWLPDFRIFIKLSGAAEAMEAFVEVKPEPPLRRGGWMGSASRQFDLSRHAGLFRRMSGTWDSEPHALLILAFPTPSTDRLAQVAVLRPTSDGTGVPWFATLQPSEVPGEAPTIDYFAMNPGEHLPRRQGPWYRKWWLHPVA
jgi:hypothetical protein